MYKNHPWKRSFQGTSKLSKDETSQLRVVIDNKTYVENAKAMVRRIIRINGYCNANILRKRYPPPDGVTPSMIGIVFQDRDFMPFRVIQGTENRGGSHLIYDYRLRDV